jgi:hypothetical protein
MAPEHAPDDVIASIASQHLNIETLRSQKSGADFHEVAVWQVEAALAAAFAAGAASARKPRRPAARAGRVMGRRKTDRELLQDALEALGRLDCAFSMCDGPFRPQIYMRVCHRCSTIYALRRRLGLSVRDPKNRREEAAHG